MIKTFLKFMSKTELKSMIFINIKKIIRSLIDKTDSRGHVMQMICLVSEAKFKL